MGCCNSDWDKVVIYNRRLKENIIYVRHKPTGEIYWDETRIEVAFKCALIFVAMPFYALGVMAWNTGKIFTNITSGSHILKCISKVVRSPFIALAIMASLLVTPIEPYRARMLEAHLENAWMDGVSYKKDFREVRAEKGMGFFEGIHYEIKNAEVFYLAWCFQSRGKINDSNHKFKKSIQRL